MGWNDLPPQETAITASSTCTVCPVCGSGVTLGYAGLPPCQQPPSLAPVQTFLIVVPASVATWPKSTTPFLAASHLPCDVHLPPNTYLCKGLDFETLIAGINARKRFPADRTVFPRTAASPSRNDVLEEAAKIADKFGVKVAPPNDGRTPPSGLWRLARDIAAAIRALKGDAG